MNFEIIRRNFDGSDVMIDGKGSVSIANGEAVMVSFRGGVQTAGSVTPAIQDFAFYDFVNRATAQELISPELKTYERLERAKMFIDRCNNVEEDFEEKYRSVPQQIELANDLQRKVAKIVSDRVIELGVVRLRSFNPGLERAERNLLQVFEDIFSHYMIHGDFDNALTFVEKIKYSPRNAVLCENLAQRFEEKKDFNKMFRAIVDCKTVTDDMKRMISLIPANELLAKFEMTSSIAVRESIMDTLLNKGMVNEVLGLIPRLSVDEQTTGYKKVIDLHWTINDIDWILKAIPYIRPADEVNAQYERVVAHLTNHNFTDNELYSVQTSLETAEKARSHDSKVKMVLMVAALCERHGDHATANHIKAAYRV